MRMLQLTLAAAVLVGCGGSSSAGGSPPDSGSGTSGPQIRISNLTFSPSELTVDAGATIVLINTDGANHSVTSEPADNVFDAGSVAGVSFDSGAIPAATGGGGGVYGGGGTSTPGRATISIPASAPSGTVIPFFCRFHTSMMTPANGHITIR